MGRVIALGPGGKAQAPVRDDRARPVIEAVRELGLLGEFLISPPCKTMQEANDLRLALYRSARYYCSCGEMYCTRKYSNVPPDNGCPNGGMRISCKADGKDTEGREYGIVTVTDPKTGRKRWAVQFMLKDKRDGIRKLIEVYGPDPDNWPYLAKRKRLKEK